MVYLEVVFKKQKPKGNCHDPAVEDAPAGPCWSPGNFAWARPWCSFPFQSGQHWDIYWWSLMPNTLQTAFAPYLDFVVPIFVNCESTTVFCFVCFWFFFLSSLPYTSRLVKTLLYNFIRQERSPPPGTHVFQQQTDGGGLLYGIASGVASESDFL